MSMQAAQETNWHNPNEATAENPSTAEYFGDIVERAMERRRFLKGAGAVGAVLTVSPVLLQGRDAEAHGWRIANPGSRLGFDTVVADTNTDIVVPDGYAYNVVVRWGDPLSPSAPDFDVLHQTKASQSQQFGFNCDLVLWYPLPAWVRAAVRRRGR